MTVLLALFLASGSPAQEPADFRRAAIVYNLSKFVLWPDDDAVGNSRTFTFCLLGEDRMAPALEQICRNAGNIVVRRIQTPEAARDCHVLFCSSAMAASLPAVLGQLNQRPVFTVSDVPGFAGKGGMVEILSAGDRVSFHINLDAAKRAGLRIKAPLLQIAKVIQGVE